MRNLTFVLFLVTFVHQSLSQENVCDGNHGQLIPDESNCWSFFQCVLSSPRHHECPEGEIFADNQCVVGDRETCEVFDLNRVCEGVFFGARFNPHDPSRRTFVSCVNGEGTLMSCADDEVFDGNQCITDRADICQNSPGQTIIHPDDCSRFIVCAIFIPFHYQCPPRMIYNQAQNRCVVGSSDMCEITAVENVCRNVFFQALPHPDSENMFVSCIREEQTINECQDSQRFESFVGECL